MSDPNYPSEVPPGILLDTAEEVAAQIELRNREDYVDVSDTDWVRIAKGNLSLLVRGFRELEAEIERLRTACIRNEHEITQTLGAALDYPRYRDDPKNFPDVTDDMVFVGLHVGVTIATEAASKIAALKAQLESTGRSGLEPAK